MLDLFKKRYTESCCEECRIPCNGSNHYDSTKNPIEMGLYAQSIFMQQRNSDNGFVLSDNGDYFFYQFSEKRDFDQKALENALCFYRKDFDYSLDSSKRCFAFSENVFQRIKYNLDAPYLIRLSSALARRADEDLTRADIISGNSLEEYGWDYDSCRTELDLHRKKLHLAMEFPCKRKYQELFNEQVNRNQKRT